MTIFEKIGIEYEERDGLLYPVLSVTDEVVGEKSVGKYGRMWMAFMKENHYGRYRSLMSCWRRLKKGGCRSIFQSLGILLWKCTSCVHRQE